MTTPSHSHAHRHTESESGSLAEMLDLDGIVSHAYLADVLDWVHRLAGETPVHRVLDLGAGTGTGTVALAARFPDAEVMAVDADADMLARIRRKILEHGPAGRVRTILADLDTAWPRTGPVDLVWAATSLHELAEPGRVFAHVLAALNPGGLLVVTEMDAPPLFLPDDIGLGRPGLESRVHDALDRAQADREPHPDWGPRLEEAGFRLLAKRTFTIDLAAPQPAATGRYARGYLRRVREFLDGDLAGEDRAVLDTLLADHGPDSLLHREDLTVAGTRTAWVAERAREPVG